MVRLHVIYHKVIYLTFPKYIFNILYIFILKSTLYGINKGNLFIGNQV